MNQKEYDSIMKNAPHQDVINQVTVNEMTKLEKRIEELEKYMPLNIERRTNSELEKRIEKLEQREAKEPEKKEVSDLDHLIDKHIPGMFMTFEKRIQFAKEIRELAIKKVNEATSTLYPAESVYEISECLRRVKTALENL